MTRRIVARPLMAEAFAPFGDVIETKDARHFPINGGKCMRYHDLAGIETAGPGGRPVISIAVSEAYELPLTVAMVERHPLGSQAFIPLHSEPFLVVVCPDAAGLPGQAEAFITDGTQGINYHRNTWHGVLTPLKGPSRFLIVDREGEGDNLQEFRLNDPFQVVVDP